jgi:mannose-6-phosphate isomerase-like protein (cupin superfamily)
MQILNRTELPSTGTASRFEGLLFGDIDLSFFWVDTLPGRGSEVHIHPYPEVFVIHGGQALFIVGQEQQSVVGGQIVVVAPHTPHQFTNVGAEPLQLIAIHPSARIEQILLEPSGVRALKV